MVLRDQGEVVLTCSGIVVVDSVIVPSFSDHLVSSSFVEVIGSLER